MWKLPNDNQTEAIPFEQDLDSSGESTTLDYKTPFMDHKKAKGIFINPKSTLRMRIERVEVAWTELRFKTKSHSNIIFVNLVVILSTNPDFSKNITQTGIRKALSLLEGIAINKSHEDMEFKISWWSIASHTFMTVWGEVHLTLEDVVVLTGLPFFGETRTKILPEDTTEVILDEEGKRKLEALNKVLSDSKSSNKSTYTSWAMHFTFGAGVGSDVEFEAMLAYWLSSYVLPSYPEDGLNSYVFPLGSDWPKEKTTTRAHITRITVL